MSPSLCRLCFSTLEQRELLPPSAEATLFFSYKMQGGGWAWLGRGLWWQEVTGPERPPRPCGWVPHSEAPVGPQVAFVPCLWGDPKEANPMGWALTGAWARGLPEVAHRGLYGTADKPVTPDLGAACVGGYVCCRQ